MRQNKYRSIGEGKLLRTFNSSFACKIVPSLIKNMAINISVLYFDIFLQCKTYKLKLFQIYYVRLYTSLRTRYVDKQSNYRIIINQSKQTDILEMEEKTIFIIESHLGKSDLQGTCIWSIFALNLAFFNFSKGFVPHFDVIYLNEKTSLNIKSNNTS